jgi:fermentation-respiration switch protein FrsA (DUF1100 family)
VIDWSVSPGQRGGAGSCHPNGALALDHVVILTPDFDRTAQALAEAGMVVIVSDLEALGARLGERLGSIHSAVQPSRHIATLRASAGRTAAVAFMHPDYSHPAL